MTDSTPVVPGTATSLSVAVLQTAPAREAVADNVREIEGLAAAAGVVDLIVTCELSVSGYAFAAEGLEALDPADARLDRLAALQPTVSVGIIEQGADGLPYNSSVLLGVGSVQRKLHPVSYAPWNEHQLVAPGDRLVPAVVNGAAVTTLICNDAWHPVLPWLAVHAGAEVLLIPTASIGDGATGESAQSWDLILTHTARILQCYVVFANRVGEENGSAFWGGSRIIDPWGNELARAGGGVETIHADLDLGALRQLRRDVPLLAERRAGLVAGMLAELDGDENV
ncbi:MAG: nitrilase-related carbon-nitrogen hydrolase [Homoserinimonas sp.]